MIDKCYKPPSVGEKDIDLNIFPHHMTTSEFTNRLQCMGDPVTNQCSNFVSMVNSYPIEILLYFKHLQSVKSKSDIDYVQL